MSSPQGIVIKCEKLRQQESPQLQTQPKSIPQPAAHSAAVTHTVTPHPLQIDAAIVTHQSNSDHTLYFSGGDSDVTAEHHMVSSGSGTASSPATSSSHGSRKSHGHITTHAGAIRVASATEDSPADMEVMDPHLASCSLRKNVAGDAGMILGNCRFGNGPAAGSPTVLQGGYTAASSSQRKEATAARLELEQLKLGLGLQLGLTVDCSDHEEMHTANNISGSDRREPSSSTSSDEGTIRTLQLFPAAAVDHDGKHHWKDPFGRFIECSGAASDPNHIARHSRLDPPPPPSDFTLNPPNTDSGSVIGPSPRISALDLTDGSSADCNSSSNKCGLNFSLLPMLQLLPRSRAPAALEICPGAAAVRDECGRALTVSGGEKYASAASGEAAAGSDGFGGGRRRRGSAAGVWFSLEAAPATPGVHREGWRADLREQRKIYLRIRDARVTVSILKQYLINKFGLSQEEEVLITCRGNLLTPSLTIQHVRDSIWLNGPDHEVSIIQQRRQNNGFRSNINELISSKDHVMELYYQIYVTLNLLRPELN